MKNKIIVLACICLLILQFGAGAQTTTGTQPAALFNFEEYTSLPQRVNYAAYANDGQFLYSINGVYFNKRISPDVLRFNPATNHWDKFKNQVSPKIKSSAVFVPSVKKIFLIGGLQYGGTGLFSGVEMIDTENGEITKLKASNPMPGINQGLATWNGKVYMFGGSADNYGTSRMYEFDPATEKFKRLADMPNTGETSGIVVEGKLYIFGGFNPYNSFIYKDICVYDIATNTWQKTGKLPENVSATSVSQKGKYVFLTGNYGSPEFIGCYNTESGQFTKFTSNMVGRRFAGSGIINDKLYIFGGNSSPIDPGVASVQGALIQQVTSASR